MPPRHRWLRARRPPGRASGRDLGADARAPVRGARCRSPLACVSRQVGHRHAGSTPGDRRPDRRRPQWQRSWRLRWVRGCLSVGLVERIETADRQVVGWLPTRPDQRSRSSNPRCCQPWRPRTDARAQKQTARSVRTVRGAVIPPTLWPLLARGGPGLSPPRCPRSPAKPRCRHRGSRATRGSTNGAHAYRPPGVRQLRVLPRLLLRPDRPAR